MVKNTKYPYNTRNNPGILLTFFLTQCSMNSMDLQDTLKNLGLSQSEAEVYLACLRMGFPKISDIAREMPIPRTSIYLHAKNLTEKGFLKKTRRAGIEHFTAVDPQEIFDAQRGKLDAFLKALPLLQSMADFSGKNTKIEYYDTIGGIRKFYESLLEIRHQEKPCLIESEEAVRYNIEKLGWNFWEKWEAKVVKKKIETEGLITQGVVPLLLSAPTDVRKIFGERSMSVRVIDERINFPFSVNLYLIAPDMAFIVIPQDNIVLAITNTSLFKSLKSIYRLLLEHSTSLNTPELFAIK